MKAGWRGWLWGLALVLLLAWALAQAPLQEIGFTLTRLRGPQLLALLGLNLLIFLLMSARWWLIVRAETRAVSFWRLSAYRLTAFGLSYFTPGPQVGGEPFQVLALRRAYGLTAARASAAVLLDKLLEFLANFLFLALGLLAVNASGMAQLQAFALPLMALLLWPVAHVGLLYRGAYPLSAALRWLGIRPARRGGKIASLARLLRLSEHLAGLFCRRHFPVLLAAVAVSLLAWAGMAWEYALMLRFLSAPLTPVQTLAALTVVRLSFLAPLPAGLGALEASQVLALSAFGLPAALGLSLALLMRARDLLLGGLGLLLALLNR